MDRIERYPSHEESEEGGSVIIRTKDLKAIKIDFKQSEELAFVSDSLEKLCEIGYIEDLHAMMWCLKQVLFRRYNALLSILPSTKLLDCGEWLVGLPTRRRVPEAAPLIRLRLAHQLR